MPPDSGYADPVPGPDQKKRASDPTAKKDDLATPRKRLNVAIDATNNNRVFQLDDLRFAAGSPDNKFQWPEAIVRLREADPNGPRPVLTINKLPQHLNQVTNEQRQNRPSIKIIPVDDKGDEEVAEVLSGIVRHIEYQSDAEVAYSTAGENQVAIGEGYMRVLTDYCDEMSFDQDIQICAVKNSFSVYLDPVGLQKEATGRYCDWGFIVEDLSEDEFARQYPNAQPINWDLTGNGDEWKAWFPDSRTVRVAEYFCFVYRKATICLWPDGSVTEKGDAKAALYEQAGMSPVKERQTTLRQLMWQKMNGCEVLEERKLPGRYIPLVRMVGNEWYIDGRMICAGLIRNAKDAQRMFNYWKSTECETLALAPKAPFVGPAEAFEGYEPDWQYANTKNFSYLKYNAFNEAGETIPKPERQVPPMPPVGIVNAALGAADDIKSATGQYDPSLGNNPQAKSGIALQREQRKTDIGTFHYIDNQARAVKQLGRIIVDIIPDYYDSRRIARIIGEDGETDHVQIDPEQQQAITKSRDEYGIEQVTVNPSIGKYDVIVSVGPSFTSKRQEAAQMMGDVLQGNPQLMSVIGDLYFKTLDVPGAEEIAERLKKTLPPGLAEDDGEPQPMVPTPQGPVPLQKAAEMIAQLMQGTEQMAQELQKADVAKQTKDAADAANRSRELEVRLAELEIERYNAQTERIKVQGSLNADEADHALATSEAMLEHARGVHELNQNAEIHENEMAMRENEANAAAAAAAARQKPNGGQAAGAMQ